MRRVPVIAAVLVIAGIAAGMALAKAAVAPVVAERQASMKAMAEAAKTISRMFEGKLHYDAAASKEAAENIRRRSGTAMAETFPAGAPAGITQSMRMAPGMTMGSSLLGKRSAVPADSDRSKVPAEHVFHLMLLQDCTNCHAKFRAKRQ